MPPSCVLQRELIRVGRVRYHGGSADVSDGEYSGNPVAVKHLKVNDGDLDRTFKVYTSKPPHPLPLLSVRLALMSRNHLLETFAPSKHFAIVGHFCVHGPTHLLHSLGVDAQRKCGAIRKIQSGGEPLATGKLLSPYDFSYLTSTQLSEVMAGVSYLHDLGIIHGDLKGVGVTLSTCPPLLTSKAEKHPR